nr:polysulfide reductase NrfD [Caldilineaceae bacterium]
PIQFGGRMAEQMVQVAYNAQHLIPWHWPVPAYLVTKAIGSGLFMLLALGPGLGLFALDGLTATVFGLFALLFIAATTGLLVWDLERPERFLLILIRPQWKSWLTRGAFLLIGFSVLAAVWWLLEMLAYTGARGAPPLRGLLLWLGLPLAGGVAVYTAFLFGQAEGRDLWQSTLLPVHLLIQSLMVGSGFALFLDLFMTLPAELTATARTVFVVLLLVDLLVTLLGEFGMPHASEVAAQAAHEISHGRYRAHYWQGSIGLGHALPLLLLWTGFPFLAALAGLCAIAGLYLYEYAFVMAPQEIANS